MEGALTLASQGSTGLMYSRQSGHCHSGEWHSGRWLCQCEGLTHECHCQGLSSYPPTLSECVQVVLNPKVHINDMQPEEEHGWKGKPHFPQNTCCLLGPSLDSGSGP